MKPVHKAKLRRFMGLTVGFGGTLAALQYYNGKDINWIAIVASSAFFGVIMTLFSKNKKGNE